MLHYGEYNFKDSLLNLKRINRIFPEFFDFDTNTFNNVIAEDSEKITTELLVRYSPLTVLRSLEFMIAFLKANNASEEILERYNENLSDLIDMKNNPQNYLKIPSYNCLRQKVNAEYTKYVVAGVSYTNFRNFMFLTFLIYEIPIKLHHLINIEFVKNSEPSECLKKKLYLNWNTLDNKFTLIFNIHNNRTLVEQIHYELRSSLCSKIFLKYIATYKKNNNLFFFTSASGRELKKSNISNGLMNFTNKLVNLPITIHDIRQVYKKMPEYEIYKMLYNF